MAKDRGIIDREKSSLFEIFSVALGLGLTSFGGPTAHLAYFQREYVQKRKWLDEKSYGDLVALCQFLPGPASSQIGMGIGTIRGGLLGGVLAWIGFTLPSALFLVIFAYLLRGYDLAQAGWIHGLKIVAVVVVAHAVWSMGLKLANDRYKATIAVISAGVLLLWPSPFMQIGVILGAAILGLAVYNKEESQEVINKNVKVSRKVAYFCLALFLALLIVLPLLARQTQDPTVQLMDSFYRSGALVFGGGHVVLPLLENEVVTSGFVSQEDFMAGYGATQAVPGPLFSFAAYLGVMTRGPIGALVALVGIFLPSFLLVIGVLPFWDHVRQNIRLKGALIGINAAVVGILLAALYNPLWVTAIGSAADFVLVMILFVMLQFWKTPPIVIVLFGAIGGAVLNI